ncbi:MAG: TIGR04372 family glycosyltransferase [Xenococcaceae cyanobacterium]
MFGHLIEYIVAGFGNLTKTVILIPHSWAIGNAFEQIYFGLLKAKRENKKLAIFVPYQLPWPLRLPLLSREIFEIESDLIAFPQSSIQAKLGGLAITAYFGLLRAFNLLPRVVFKIVSQLGLAESFVFLRNVHKFGEPMAGEWTLWQPKINIKFSEDIVKDYDWPHQFRHSPKVKLPDERKQLAEEQRILLGLPKDSRFFCLHVRESGYWNEDQKIAKPRVASIDNYIDAIKTITDKGIWVVRMGDKTMKPLPKKERIIDYALTEFKSPLMDLYLVSECDAYVGMQSGILDLAVLFQRPIILTNMYNWLFGYHLFKKSDVGIFKHVYSKPKKKMLTVREWLMDPYEATNTNPLSLQDNYDFIENTSEELREVVEEFLEDNLSHTSLQVEFNRLRQLRGKEILRDKVHADHLSDTILKYRYASRLESACGKVGSKFLLDNY